MMHITLAPEPTHFQKEVYEPGHNAMAAQCGLDIPYPNTRKGQGIARLEDVHVQDDIPSDKLKPYWTDILDDLMNAYNCICAYTCMSIHEITGSSTVDHILPKSMHWEKAYQWDNYLLVCGKMNAKKSNRTDILDPMDIGEDWFRLDMCTLEVYPNSELPEDIKQRVQNTIDQLALNRKKLTDVRLKYLTDYLEGKTNLAMLEQTCPFVAKEYTRYLPQLKPVEEGHESYWIARFKET